MQPEIEGRRPRQFFAIAILALVCASACKTHVVLSTSTRLGVELASYEQGRSSASIGYARRNGVRMPACSAVVENAPKTCRERIRNFWDILRGEWGKCFLRSQAYSTLSLFATNDAGLLSTGTGLEVSQVFATGAAANQMQVGTTLSYSFASVTGAMTPDVERISKQLLALLPAPQLGLRPEAIMPQSEQERVRILELALRNDIHALRL